MNLVAALWLQSREAVNVRKGRGVTITCAATDVTAACVAPALVLSVVYNSSKRRKIMVTKKRRFSSTDPGASLCDIFLPK